MAEVLISQGFEKILAGYYPAIFTEIKEKETINGLCFRWEFKIIADGKVVSGLAGEPGKGATIKSKYGRWLCGIAGKPLAEGSVDPVAYIGKPYMVIVDDKGNVSQFTKMPG